MASSSTAPSLAIATVRDYHNQSRSIVAIQAISLTSDPHKKNALTTTTSGNYHFTNKQKNSVIFLDEIDGSDNEVHLATMLPIVTETRRALTTRAASSKALTATNQPAGHARSGPAPVPAVFDRKVEIRPVRLGKGAGTYSQKSIR
jgi:hypothetical protein